MKTIKDKDFVPLIDKQKIKERIQELADKISGDFENENPLILGILNGSFMFLSDLMKKLTIDCQMTFLKVNSYQDLKSTGKVNELIGLQENIENRTIIVVEDIVDTGRTMKWVLEKLHKNKPKSIYLVSLLSKPSALVEKIHIDYCGFEIEDKFVVGYGLDYDGFGRNLPEIMVLKE